MKNTAKTIAIVGAAAAVLGVGAITYAVTNDGPGPFGDGNGRGGGQGQHDQQQMMANRASHSGMQNGNQNGNQNGMGNGMGANVQTTLGTLDSNEEASLQYMVQEEKLAHDVYVTLGNTWNLPIFDRIAASESQHVSAIQTLLSRYGVSDPTSGLGVGEFADSEFTALYNDLVARGEESADAAMQVGVDIEKLDIADLSDRLATTDQADVVTVFEHLQTASNHHLAAFQGEPMGGMQHQGNGNGNGNGR